jgi:hypothetical protein
MRVSYPLDPRIGRGLLDRLWTQRLGGRPPPTPLPPTDPRDTVVRDAFLRARAEAPR